MHSFHAPQIPEIHPTNIGPSRLLLAVYFDGPTLSCDELTPSSLGETSRPHGSTEGFSRDLPVSRIEVPGPEPRALIVEVRKSVASTSREAPIVSRYNKHVPSVDCCQGYHRQSGPGFVQPVGPEDSSGG